MNLNPGKPRKALNKAWLKAKPNRNQIETFKQNLKQLLGHISETDQMVYALYGLTEEKIAVVERKS